MSAPTVVMHRPPRQRIDFNPVRRPADAPTVDIDCIAKFQEQERIWRLLKQCAEGCNAAGEVGNEADQFLG